MPAKAHHHIYVIELDKAVLTEKKFLKANPRYVPGKTCFYVGMTGRTPDVRFEQHRAGYKSARFVKKYGVRLRPEHYESLNPMPYKKACAVERVKAFSLRQQGFGVWQN